MNKAATYISLPTPCRTPDRLATIATLQGLNPTNIGKAKVLDIGCGQGWDLIALAYTYPYAQFVGIDFSIEAIEVGRTAIKQLKLNNIRLECTDISKYSSQEKYDYIFCHGVYSWVSEELGNIILQKCNEFLTTNGLAYISYNALPAWSNRSILREALRHFTMNLPEQDKVATARKTIDDINNVLLNYPSPYSQGLQLELKNAQKSSDGFIIQELLAEESHAEYLHTFIKKAKNAKLKYISEAQVERMLSQRMDEITDSQPLAASINNLPLRQDKEQALEFLFPTWLRQAVLCRSDLVTDPDIPLFLHEKIADLFIASPLVPSDPKDPEGGYDVFMSPLGSHIQIQSNYIRQALHKLITCWPNWISVRELYDSLTNRPCYALSDFTKDLLPLFQKGLIELHTAPAPFTTTITEKPQVSALAQLQIKEQDWSTNLKQEYTTFTNFEKQLIPYLNGENDKDTLVEKMLLAISEGDLAIKDEFHSQLEDLELKEIVTEGIEETRSHLVESALLLK